MIGLPESSDDPLDVPSDGGLVATGAGTKAAICGGADIGSTLRASAGFDFLPSAIKLATTTWIEVSTDYYYEKIEHIHIAT